MSKELKIEGDLYFPMEDGETEWEAILRFHHLLSELNISQGSLECNMQDVPEDEE